MDVLIFGANSQDGRYLASHCASQGLQVSGVSRRDAPIIGDVADREFVTRLIRSGRPKFVFHLAARSSTRHDAAVENHAAIGTGTLNVLEAAYHHSPDTRVFIAGSALQFVNQSHPISENDPLDASSAYAAVRNYAMFLARYYRRAGLKVYFGFLFHHESPLRKPEHVSQLIADAARRAAKGEKFRLEIGDLAVRKEWTFAGDMVGAIWTLVRQDTVFEANLGTGETHSIADWVQECFTAVGKNSSEFIVQKAGFTAEYPVLVADATRIFSLGWRPCVTFPELARMMVKGCARAV